MNNTLSMPDPDFSGLLNGQRDYDLARNFAGSISDSFRKGISILGNEQIIALKTTKSGFFSTKQGQLGSAHFSIAHILSEGSFLASCFHFEFDSNPDSIGPIEGVKLSKGLSFPDIYDGNSYTANEPYLHFRKMKRWDRQILKLGGLRIDSDNLPFDEGDIVHCACPPELIRMIKFSPCAIANWMCVLCAKRYICSCADLYLNKLCQRERYDNSSYIELSQIAERRDSICHLCREIPSETQYRADFYGSVIKQFYSPYIMQEAVTKEVDQKEAENLVRDRLGVPRIGEGWVSEMMLIRTARYLFPELTVQQQASPLWLGRQRFDGFIPEFGIALEYNGEQHYNAVGLFGGDAGLRATQERDKKKMALAKENGIEVVIFKYDETLSEELIATRISNAIARQAFGNSMDRGAIAVKRRHN